MNKSRVVLLVALLLIAGGLGFKLYEEERIRAIQQEVQEKMMAQSRAAAAEMAARRAAEKAMEDTTLVRALPAAYPRPASDWQQGEKAVYEKLLSNGKSDVLVVPLQVMGWSFDASTRSLMTAELSMAVAGALNIKLPDPYLVARALGDGQRQFKMEAIYQLADVIGAKRVIWGHAGHDRKGQMTVVLMSQERRGGVPWSGPVQTSKFEKIPMEGDTPPIVAFESRLADFGKALGLAFATPLQPQVEASLGLAKLPESPAGLYSTGENPARDAYAYLLYAALTPAYMERTRYRFAEKAYLSLLRLSPASPEYPALRARAFMELGFRPAALQALGEPKTTEALALAAALNGNLSDVRAAADKETNGLKRLLQKLDANAIGVAYGLLNARQSAEEVNRLKMPGRIWPYLATRALVDWDGWSQFDNVAPKMIMDIDLPVKGYSLEEIVRGAVSVGDAEKMQVLADQSVNEHVRKLFEAEAGKICCETATQGPHRLDYLELLQVIGHDNLLRRINYYSGLQGNPRVALRYANSIDAVYRGHPYFTLELARLKNKLAATVVPTERELHVKDAYEMAFNAMYWAQGQSRIAAEASDEIARSGRSDFGYYDNPYFTDIPYSPDYWTWSSGGVAAAQLENRLAALKNATRQFDVVKELFHGYRMQSPDDPRSIELLKSIDGRFVGSPQKNDLLALEARRQGDVRAAAALLRENIRISPGYWKSYADLGQMLFMAGDHREAARVLQSYPGFRKGSGENRVGVANLSYEAGSHFYWTGHFDLAESFYRITLAQKTGAAVEMIADGRMKLVAGDVFGAMAALLERAQRYDASGAYADYLGMLHASGQSKQAWAGMNSLLRDGRSSRVLESALVGWRMAAAPDSEVLDWVRRPEILTAGDNKNAGAAMLLEFATTDRIPSQEMAQLLQDVDRPIVRFKAGTPYVVRTTKEGEQGKIVGPEPMEEDAYTRIGQVDAAVTERVKSDLSYFAAGYRALKLKDFAAAKVIFGEAAGLYDMTRSTAYMLPYYAYAAARVGDVTTIEGILAKMKGEKQGPDYFLARAVLAGAAGRHDEALQALDIGRRRFIYLKARPVRPSYAYGDMCELVAELTGNARIRDFALDYARTFQKIETWQAWPYAMEARLTRNPQDRGRAVAMAHYLDPKSDRLSTLKKAEIEQAIRVHGKANPFLQRPVERSPGEKI